jgi:hypothetical protein
MYISQTSIITHNMRTLHRVTPLVTTEVKFSNLSPNTPNFSETYQVICEMKHVGGLIDTISPLWIERTLCKEPLIIAETLRVQIYLPESLSASPSIRLYTNC